MSGRFGLVPVVLMLALVAGCRDSSDDSAQAGNGVAPPAVVATLLPAEAAPVDNAIVPVKASPVVTVRAQPAPRSHGGNVMDLPPSDDDVSALPFPQEVTAFMVDRDGCDHFRGEEAYDAERRAYIAENVAELCQGTDARLAMLRRRYAGDASVTSALKGYDAHIEGVSNY